MAKGNKRVCSQKSFVANKDVLAKTRMKKVVET